MLDAHWNFAYNFVQTSMTVFYNFVQFLAFTIINTLFEIEKIYNSSAKKIQSN